MAAFAIDDGGASKTREHVPSNGQSEGHEGMKKSLLHESWANHPQIAEDLYTKGWISYPRTETDQFDKAIDLKKIIEKQVQSQTWGPYAQGWALPLLKLAA